MGSQQKETRQLQLDQITAQIEKRTDLLKSQDKTEADITKDAQLKKLRGNLRRTRAALASIEKLAATVADARKKKEAGKAKGTDAGSKKKKKKSKAEAAPEKKKKKEKKQK